MKIIKILNNNSAVVTDNNIESVAMGKGLAFGKKPGDIIDRNSVNRIYNLKTNELTERLADILANVDIQVFDFCKTQIDEMKIELDYILQDSIYINLTDHIQATLRRIHNNEHVINTLAMEIKRFYPVEYRLADRFIRNLNKRFSVSLDQNEAGFVALHLIDASLNNSNNSYSIKITTMIKDIVNIVRRYFGIALDEDSIYYYRFICHLRLFGQRLFLNDELDNLTLDAELLQMISKKYEKSYHCALLIGRYIGEQYKNEVTDSEILYLTIHIQRIYEEYLKKGEGDYYE